MFSERGRNRSRIPKKSAECSKLLIDSELTTDAEVLLADCVKHFETLAKPRSEDLGT